MRKLLYKKHKLIGNKGFSLVELIIVIAIMAVLMAVLAPQLLKYVEKSRIQADDTAASEILNAVNVALADDAVFSLLAEGNTIVWNAAVTPATITTGAAAPALAPAALLTEVQTTIGTPAPSAKSQLHKAAATDTFTITIHVDTVTHTTSTTTAWG